ncbi:hypothetical protein JXA48_02145 [Candidatus Woesearchaeota archaeon]|nr:hypothetical protein [Candidatus Woesearchaeota archaeon]
MNLCWGLRVTFDREQAKKVLIKPFKEKGRTFIEENGDLQYPRLFFNKLSKSETQERLTLLTYFYVLFDTQKQSRYHYRDMLKLYVADNNFLTLENILKRNHEQAKKFVTNNLGTMAKKGVYLIDGYTRIKTEYDSNIMNLVDKDVAITQKRIEAMPGFGDQVAGLFLHTLRDNKIFKFENEEDLCPKVDFHDYNLGVSTGIIKDLHGETPQTRKTLYSQFLRDLAKEENINIFDLDSYMWAIGQICVQKNISLCEYQCPLSSLYEGPRTFYLKNDYSEKATTKKNKKIADELQVKLGFKFD